MTIPSLPYLIFDGVDDYLDCGNQPNLWSKPLSKFSFTFWVKCDSVDLTNRTLVDHGYFSNHSFLCHRDNGNGEIIWFRIRDLAGNDFLAGILPSTSILNRWIHVACVYDSTLPNTNLKIYVDGILGGTTGDLTETINLSTSLFINGATAGYQKGSFKDFRWFTDRALSEAEVIDISNDNEFLEPDYWLKLNEGNTNPTDFISKELRATLTNGAKWSSLYSFSPISFSNTSFTTTPVPHTGGGGKGKKNKYRNYINSLAKGLRDFFKIKQRPPEPEEVPIPPAQYPAGQKVTILAEPPTKEKPISVVASIPSDSPRGLPVEGELVAPPLPVYPLILNPITAPLIQTKVTLPRASRSIELPTAIRGEGSHIESSMVGLKKPKKSKAAAINTLMILLEIERQV